MTPTGAHAWPRGRLARGNLSRSRATFNPGTPTGAFSVVAEPSRRATRERPFHLALAGWLLVNSVHELPGSGTTCWLSHPGSSNPDLRSFNPTRSGSSPHSASPGTSAPGPSPTKSGPPASSAEDPYGCNCQTRGTRPGATRLIVFRRPTQRTITRSRPAPRDRMCAF